jgi:hypothetical protein
MISTGLSKLLQVYGRSDVQYSSAIMSIDLFHILHCKAPLLLWGEYFFESVMVYWGPEGGPEISINY